MTFDLIGKQKSHVLFTTPENPHHGLSKLNFEKPFIVIIKHKWKIRCGFLIDDGLAGTLFIEFIIVTVIIDDELKN